MAAPDNLAEIPNQRAKRADCDSTFGDWSEWTTCDKDCGFCGTQSRSRVCTSSSGCDCTGETTESQACSTSDTICLAPSASCCPHTYIKKVDILNRRFFCGLE
uniref:Thrombospondin type 1 domain protein n=1 Tax=Caenorhabditis japonica TaxID=281687 RepID=A0A8R1HXB6_CAEJA